MVLKTIVLKLIKAALQSWSNHFLLFLFCFLLLLLFLFCIFDLLCFGILEESAASVIMLFSFCSVVSMESRSWCISSCRIIFKEEVLPCEVRACLKDSSCAGDQIYLVPVVLSV